jgi:hypothetical protein
MFNCKVVLNLGHFGKKILYTWQVLKRGAGEGWIRPFGPIVCGMRMHYTVSRGRGILYIQ